MSQDTFRRALADKHADVLLLKNGQDVSRFVGTTKTDQNRAGLLNGI